MPAKILLRKLLITAIAAGSIATGHAAGFQINVQGLRQLGLGGTGVAYPWDNGTIFYNPGALSRLKHAQITGSILGIFPATRLYQPATGVVSDAQSQVFTPFNLYASTPLRQVKGLSLGLGVYTPFGTGLKWADNWTGRYVIQDIGLQSVFVQPTVSYQINDLISIGGGFVYAFGNFHLNKALPLTFQNEADGQARLKGSASGAGYNLGVHLQATPAIALGLSYRSSVRMNVKNGTADFQVPASVAANFPNTDFKTELPLPSVLSLGAKARITQKFTLSIEGNYVGWKRYDTLRFDYQQETAALKDTRAPRLYESKITGRLGLNYTINNKVDVMIGGAYDASPVRDHFVSPDLPDADRLVFTAGAHLKATERLSLTAALEFVNAQKRDGWYDAENFGGTYQTKAFTAGIGASWTFTKSTPQTGNR